MTIAERKCNLFFRGKYYIERCIHLLNVSQRVDDSIREVAYFSRLQPADTGFSPGGCASLRLKLNSVQMLDVYSCPVEVPGFADGCVRQPQVVERFETER